MIYQFQLEEELKNQKTKKQIQEEQPKILEHKDSSIFGGKWKITT